jgi:HAD superfamily hydrolase (TIGR01459 family)
MTLSASVHPIPILDSISSLARRYDVWLTDIWGVMHNGLQPFSHAIEACQLFRQGGGTLILISNSPRPHQTAAEQLREIGVPADCYDAIATSGDVTRRLIAEYAGKSVFHLGPERDLPRFDGLGVRLGGTGDSAVVVCSGLWNDEVETPDDYAGQLQELRGLGLAMICANPDIKVERGERLIYCAGALAEAYAAIGGEVIYAGKPHKPIYDLAFALAEEKRGAAVPRHRILAIGDGIRTDIAGATAQKIDSIYIASAVHMTGGAGAALTSAVLSELFSHCPVPPVAALPQLIW